MKFESAIMLYKSIKFKSVGPPQAVACKDSHSFGKIISLRHQYVQGVGDYLDFDGFAG
jgi:hypothetical protein